MTMLRTGAATALAAALSGCLTAEVAPCADDAMCRDAFGFGNVCGESGYCERLELIDRCHNVWPADLLDDPETYRDAIVFGSMYDAAYDAAEVQSARLAIIQANDEGGLENRSFGVIECTYEENSDYDDLDYDGATSEVAVFLADRVGVPGIIGPYTSSQTEAAYNATKDRVFIISPSATSPALTYIDGLEKSDENPGYLWRTAPTDAYQGAVAARYLDEMGHSHVAVVYQSGPYGEGLAEIFIEEFTARGGTADSYEFDDENSRAEAIADVQNTSELDVTQVFFISSETSDIAAFLNAAANKGFETRGIFLSDAAADTDLLADTEDVSELDDQIRGTRPSAPSGAVFDAFAAAYSAEYQQDPYATVYMPYAFDAAWLSIFTSAWSLYQEDAVTALGLARGMRHVSSGDEIEIRPTNWSTLKAYFQTGRTVDVVGTSGELDYDPETGETSAPIDIWRINDSRDGFDTERTYN